MLIDVSPYWKPPKSEFIWDGNDLIKLNLGSGNTRYRAGFLNLDCDPRVDPDILAHVPPIPLPDLCCSDVFTSHFLEHLDSATVDKMMAEIWRVLAVSGTAEIIVPYALGHQAWQDPTHKTFFVPERFLYYTPHFRYLNYPLETRFQAIEAEVTPVEVRVVLRKEADYNPCVCPMCTGKLSVWEDQGDGRIVLRSV